MKSKKSVLAFVIAVSCITFTYAHETGVPHEEPAVMSANEVKLVPIPADGRRPVTVGVQTGVTGGTQAQVGGLTQRGMEGRPVTRVASGTAQVMPGQVGKPTTGDPALDAQIQALNTEMEAKVKAIRDEYTAKIRQLVANKKLTPGVSTTTRREIRSSSTEQNRGIGAVRGVSEMNASIEIDPSKRFEDNFIKNFFSKIFGK
jgi:hypothetical protein